MRELKNHPSPDQLDSYDKYPCYYENDLELVYTPQQSIFTLWENGWTKHPVSGQKQSASMAIALL